MKLKPVVNGSGMIMGYVFYCPGCKHAHVFYTAGLKIWGFNGDLLQPTFTPSLLNRCPDHTDLTKRSCHLNLTLGQLHFHNDCSHELAGKDVALPEWPWDTAFAQSEPEKVYLP